MAPRHFAGKLDFTRRHFLATSAATVSSLALSSPAFCKEEAAKVLAMGPVAGPITGVAHAELSSLDEFMQGFIAQYKVPGASLAVSHGDKLVYARGFGYSNLEKKEPVTPRTIFRIASITKSYAAVGIMQLVEQEKIGLDNKVVDLLNVEPYLMPGVEPDERWEDITVRHCLQHRGGWDRDISYDPVSFPRPLVKKMGVKLPIQRDDILRFMMGQPLDFAPGDRYAYSNFGFLILDRLLQEVSGQEFIPYVTEHILKPLGVERMCIARALQENQSPGEATYYDPGNRTRPAMFPPKIGQTVPRQYGGENTETYGAHGALVGSAADLVRFMSAFNDLETCPLLQADTIRTMWERPEKLAGFKEDGTPKKNFYSCGWMMQSNSQNDSVDIFHRGYLTGSESTVYRRPDGVNWAVLYNTASPKNTPLAPASIPLINARLNEITAWPSTDHFAEILPASQG